MTKEEQSPIDALLDMLWGGRAWKDDIKALDEVERREFIRELEAIMEKVRRRIDTLAASDDHKKN
jgi:hypothetical protein